MEKQKYHVNCRSLRFLLVAAALAALFATVGLAQVDTYLPWEGGAQYYAQWKYSLRSDQDFFPIGTWDQSPWNAPLFQGIGFKHRGRPLRRHRRDRSGRRSAAASAPRIRDSPYRRPAERAADSGY